MLQTPSKATPDLANLIQKSFENDTGDKLYSPG
jgi:hypothetical protein